MNALNALHALDALVDIDALDVVVDISVVYSKNKPSPEGRERREKPLTRTRIFRVASVKGCPADHYISQPNLNNSKHLPVRPASVLSLDISARSRT